MKLSVAQVHMLGIAPDEWASRPVGIGQTYAMKRLGLIEVREVLIEQRGQGGRVKYVDEQWRRTAYGRATLDRQAEDRAAGENQANGR